MEKIGLVQINMDPFMLAILLMIHSAIRSTQFQEDQLFIYYNWNIDEQQQYVDNYRKAIKKVKDLFENKKGEQNLLKDNFSNKIKGNLSTRDFFNYYEHKTKQFFKDCGQFEEIENLRKSAIDYVKTVIVFKFSTNPKTSESKQNIHIMSISNYLIEIKSIIDFIDKLDIYNTFFEIFMNNIEPILKSLYDSGNDEDKATFELIILDVFDMMLFLTNKFLLRPQKEQNFLEIIYDDKNDRSLLLLEEENPPKTKCLMYRPYSIPEALKTKIVDLPFCDFLVFIVFSSILKWDGTWESPFGVTILKLNENMKFFELLLQLEDAKRDGRANYIKITNSSYIKAYAYSLDHYRKNLDEIEKIRRNQSNTKAKDNEEFFEDIIKLNTMIKKEIAVCEALIQKLRSASGPKYMG